MQGKEGDTQAFAYRTRLLCSRADLFEVKDFHGRSQNRLVDELNCTELELAHMMNSLYNTARIVL